MQDCNGMFASFSVKRLDEASDFYRDVLELDVTRDEMGLDIRMAGGGRAFVYAKEDHEPATFTVLNFLVEDIDAAMERLLARNVRFETYDTNTIRTDARGVLAHEGMKVAWFKDPAGNVFSLIEDG